MNWSEVCWFDPSLKHAAMNWNEILLFWSELHWTETNLPAWGRTELNWTELKRTKISLIWTKMKVFLVELDWTEYLLSWFEMDWSEHMITWNEFNSAELKWSGQSPKWTAVNWNELNRIEMYAWSVEIRLANLNLSELDWKTPNCAEMNWTVLN